MSILEASLLNQLRDLDPPEPHLMGSAQPEPTAASLREGRFHVYGRAASLTPPIDWQQDPYGSRSWCYYLHSLIWLTPAFLAYSRSGDRVALTVGLGAVTDWVSSHLDNSGSISEFAWNDMAVSQRTPALAYALRAGLSADLLDEADAELILLACDRHGHELADEAKYSAGHNHGLAQDEALYLLANQLPVLPTARAWSELAVRRMRMTMAATIDETEGAHLEHSTGYQFTIARMVSRLSTTMEELPELGELSDRLHRTAAWHVTPSGRIAQLGDSDDTPAPDWAVTESRRQRGLKALYGTGNAFVRSGDSYLAVSSGYHSSAHKHADDTGFLLVESGRTVLGDAGRWGYYEDEPDRLYARSAHAHNVLTVDGQDFDWLRQDPYGSGLLAATESKGWHAILVTNPLLAHQGVTHRRLLLYRPAETLVVMDEVRADEVHEYARRFHFGPALEARLDAEGRIVLADREPIATLTDFSPASEVELIHGQDQPTRLGWTYPRDRERTPVHVATLRCQARNATLAAALTFGNAKLAIQRAELDGDRAVVETDQGQIEVQLTPDERRAEFTFHRT
jgi:hypothetical protein